VDGISFDSILESEINWLERAFEEVEEVRNVTPRLLQKGVSGYI
jgi:hypothetical protein